MTHFVNPERGRQGDLVAHLVELTERRRRLQLRVRRQRRRSCARRSSAAIAAGASSVIIGVAGAGQEIATRPFQLVTGPRLEGHGVRRRARAHRRAENRRLVHGREDRHRLADHAHAAARAHQRGLRPDARGQVDPHGRHVLTRTDQSAVDRRARAVAADSIGDPAVPAARVALVHHVVGRRLDARFLRHCLAHRRRIAACGAEVGGTRGRKRNIRAITGIALLIGAGIGRRIRAGVRSRVRARASGRCRQCEAAASERCPSCSRPPHRRWCRAARPVPVPLRPRARSAGIGAENSKCQRSLGTVLRKAESRRIAREPRDIASIARSSARPFWCGRVPGMGREVPPVAGLGEVAVVEVLLLFHAAERAADDSVTPALSAAACIFRNACAVGSPWACRRR